MKTSYYLISITILLLFSLSVRADSCLGDLETSVSNIENQLNKSTLRAVFKSLSADNCDFYLIETGREEADPNEFNITGTNIRFLGENAITIEGGFSSVDDAKDRLIEYFITINKLNMAVSDFQDGQDGYLCTNSNITFD